MEGEQGLELPDFRGILTRRWRTVAWAILGTFSIFVLLAALLPNRYESSSMLLIAIDNATNAPLIEAVRVPPSACSTSQSSVIVRSPSAWRSVTARKDRPMRR